MTPLLLVGALAAGALVLVSRGAQAMPFGTPPDPKQNTLDALFEKHGARYGVDPLLLKALAMRESSLNPSAVRWNPPRDISVGLMQVLYLPSNMDDVNSRPTNRFDVDGWSEATFDKLKDPDFNIQIGAQIIAWNIRNFGMPRGVAVFNSWDQRREPLNGPFKNQNYVDDVISNYRKLSGAA